MAGLCIALDQLIASHCPSTSYYNSGKTPIANSQTLRFTATKNFTQHGPKMLISKRAFHASLYLSICVLFLTSFVSVSPTFGQDKNEDKAEQTSDEKRAAERARRKTRREAAGRFMRIRKDAKGRELALETSVTRYEMLDKDNNLVTVDLIGAVHVGEKEYYDALNKRFEQYESMLYELVAPEGTVIPKGGGRRDGVPTNPIALMQKGMQTSLALEFQLEHIDYTKKNFTHADMTPEEFSESMVENDESLGGYAARAIGQSMAMQSAGRGGDSMGMLMAMFSKNKELRLRRAFAKQIQDMEAGMIVFEGREGSTIIDHRNRKCLKILKQEIESGKRNLAIFYGAGHLVSMEESLINDFGMKRGGQYWLEAWKLSNHGKKNK